MSLFSNSSSASLFTQSSNNTGSNTGSGTTTASPDFSGSTLLCSDLKSNDGFLSTLFSNVASLNTKTSQLTYDGTNTKINSKLLIKTSESTVIPNTIPIYTDKETIKKTNVTITGGTDINCSNLISDTIYSGCKSFASHPITTKQGLIYYNTTEKRLKIYQNNKFVDLNYHNYSDSNSSETIRVAGVYSNSHMYVNNNPVLSNLTEILIPNSIVKFNSSGYTTKQSNVIIDDSGIISTPSYLKIFNQYKTVGFINSYLDYFLPVISVVNNHPLLKASSFKITNDLFEGQKIKCTEITINNKQPLLHDSTIVVNSIPYYDSSTDTVLKCSSFNINPTTDTLNGNKINCSELFVNNVALSTNFTNLETKVDNIDTAFTSLQTNLPTLSQVTNIHNVLVSLYNLVQSLSITNISGLTQAILDSNTNNSPYNYFTSTAVDDNAITTNSTWSSSKINGLLSGGGSNVTLQNNINAVQTNVDTLANTVQTNLNAVVAGVDALKTTLLVKDANGNFKNTGNYLGNSYRNENNTGGIRLSDGADSLFQMFSTSYQDTVANGIATFRTDGTLDKNKKASVSTDGDLDCERIFTKKYITIGNVNNENECAIDFKDNINNGIVSFGGFEVKGKDDIKRCSFGSLKENPKQIGITSFNNEDNIVFSTNSTPSLTVESDGDIVLNKKTGSDAYLKIDATGKIYTETGTTPNNTTSSMFNTIKKLVEDIANVPSNPDPIIVERIFLPKPYTEESGPDQWDSTKKIYARYTNTNSNNSYHRELRINGSTLGNYDTISSKFRDCTEIFSDTTLTALQKLRKTIINDYNNAQTGGLTMSELYSINKNASDLYRIVFRRSDSTSLYKEDIYLSGSTSGYTVSANTTVATEFTFAGFDNIPIGEVITAHNLSTNNSNPDFIVSQQSNVTNNNLAYKAFNNNFTDKFYSDYSFPIGGGAANSSNTFDIGTDTVNGPWVKMEFRSGGQPISKTFNAYRIAGDEGDQYSPKSWFLHGSDDGVTYTTFHSNNKTTSYANKAKYYDNKIYKLESPVSYKFVVLQISGVGAGVTGTDDMHLRQFQLLNL